MMRLPREARDGVMRAWLAILRENQPEFTWIAVEDEPSERESANTSAEYSASSDEQAVESDLVPVTA